MNLKKNEENKILKLLDEILIQKKEKRNDSPQLKETINSLSNKELEELLALYSDIIKYESSKETKQVPDFYMYRISDYYQKLKTTQKHTVSLPYIVIQLFQNTLSIIENSLPNFKVETIPIQTYRNNGELKSNKIMLEDLSDGNKKVEFSFIPQEQSVLLSIFLQNITGNLTLKLKRSNHIIDIKHFSNLKQEERINIENLKKGDYIIDFSGSYTNQFGFKITD